MSDKEYLACDEEVFAMVNNGRRNRPVAALVSMEKIQQMDEYYRQMDERDKRIRQMQNYASAAVPVGIGLASIGAMARDLMSPSLTICVLGACVVYAAVKCWRGGNG